MFSKMKNFAKGFAKKASFGAGALLTAMAVTTPASAAEWDTAAIVKTITDGASIVTSLGTAILGVIVLTFGFKMARGMLKSG